MKKLTSILIGLATVVGLSACSAGEVETTKSDNQVGYVIDRIQVDGNEVVCVRLDRSDAIDCNWPTPEP